MGKNDDDTRTLLPPLGQDPGATWAPGATVLPLSDRSVTLSPSVEDAAATADRFRDAPTADHVAGRYRLGLSLGVGANGTVYQAVDELTGGDCAVKLVRSPDRQDLARIRAEVTALRWLRLPGVVRLLDDGMDGHDYFLVMQLVRGTTFLGAGRATWEDIAGPVCELLENLARVHLAGVLHRDLKPGNILLDHDGHPVLVDFGLALGRALREETWAGAGTVRYVAPEQAQGLPCGPQADLYSLGVMLYEALSGGVLPQRAQKSRAIIRERVDHDPRPLGQVAPGVPEPVRQLVDRLLARDPAARPASALEVLEALGGDAPAVLSGGLLQRLPADLPATPQQLRALFRGPDLLLHLREDAADVLLLRTGGHRALVFDELRLWVQAGLATWQGDLVALDRLALEQLRTGHPLAVETAPPPDLSQPARDLLCWLRRAWPDTDTVLGEQPGPWGGPGRADAVAELIDAGLAWRLPDGRVGVRPVIARGDAATERQAHQAIALLLPEGSEARLRHLVAAGGDDVDLLAEARRVAEELFRAGRHVQTMAVLERALQLARTLGGHHDHEEALLVAWAKVAMAEESPPALDRALYELGRAGTQSRRLDRVEALLRAWSAAFVHDPPRAEHALQQAGDFDDPDLALACQAARVVAHLQDPPEQRAAQLERLDAWASGNRRWQARVEGWWGNLAYVQEQYTEAASRHLRSAELQDHQAGRVACIVNAAWALLDGGEHARAMALVEQVRGSIAASRMAAMGWRCLYVERSVLYRTGAPVPPAPKLADAVALVSVGGAAGIAMIEAARAWRSGQGDAGGLAAHGASLAQSARALSVEAICRALLALVQDRPQTVDVVEQLRVDDLPPGIAVQVLGLLGHAGGPDAAWFFSQAAARARDAGLVLDARRREVLSHVEAVGGPIHAVAGAAITHAVPLPSAPPAVG